jgi:hypothetical protein
MKSLWTSTDPTYTSINLSIFAVTEVFVGAFTASLPPLRKTFETILCRVLPESILGSSSHSRKSMGKNSYALKEVGNSYVLNGNAAGSQSRPKHDLDNDSEHSMLEAQHSKHSMEGKDSVGMITCTTDLSVTVDERGSIRSRGQDWV